SRPSISIVARNASNSFSVPAKPTPAGAPDWRSATIRRPTTCAAPPTPPAQRRSGDCWSRGMKAPLWARRWRSCGRSGVASTVGSVEHRLDEGVRVDPVDELVLVSPRDYRAPSRDGGPNPGCRNGTRYSMKLQPAGSQAAPLPGAGLLWTGY